MVSATGRKLLIRNINHILYYAELPIKRMIPIMLTILGIHSFNIHQNKYKNNKLFVQFIIKMAINGNVLFHKCLIY